MGANNSSEISRLPHDCLSRVIAFTTPRDACRCAAVSTAFRASAYSDAVWEHLLPPDLPDILSRTADSLPACVSKKELYLLLCRQDILLDNGTMSFRLEKKSGAKTFMLSARSIWFAWDHIPEYWQWSPYHDSRFAEVARLLLVWWFEMAASFNLRELSPKTTYSSYLVFKLEDSDGLDVPHEAFVRIRDYELKHTVCLQPGNAARTRQQRKNDMRFPRERSDGWTEVELGEFRNDKVQDDLVVRIGLNEIKKLWVKKGLIVQGIEIRPKICE